MLDPKTESEALDFLNGLAKVIRTVKMYSPGHPAVSREEEQCHGLLSGVLARVGTLSVGLSGDQLLLQETPVRQVSGAAERFRDLLTERYIESIVIEQGLKKSELSAFIRLISSPAEEVLEGGAIRPSLAREFHKIRFNAVSYRVVRGDETVIRSDAPEVSYSPDLPLEDRLSSLFDEEFGAESAGPPRSGAGQPGTVPMSRFFQRLGPMVSQLNASDRESLALEYYQMANKKLSEQGDLGVEEHAKRLSASVASMDSQLQEALFDRTFEHESEVDLDGIFSSLDPGVKSRILLNEIRLGTQSDESLKRKIDLLLSADEDVVELVETISQEVGELGGRQAAEVLGRVFRSIQEGEDDTLASEVGVLSVLLADSDETFAEEAAEVLERAGFRVRTQPDGAQAYREIVEEAPDLVVMDIKLSGMSGIEILSRLDAEKRHVPIVVCSDQVQFRETFEVQMYPRMRFLRKPFQFRQFFDAVDELLPVSERTREKDSGAVREKEDVEEDLRKARKIQSRLLPGRIPEMPGLDVSVYYKASRSVGGDYFDFIPIDEDHLGIVVADVSGKGVSGAMVMVMARSIFRSVAPLSLSPRDTIIRANQLLAADIRRGMFLTAYYMVVNVPACEVNLCCAGHNPAIVWDETMELCSFSESRGIALGLVSSDSFEDTLREESISLRVGDRLFFYTDGVTECMNFEEEEFGEKRLIQALNQVSRNSSQSVLRTLLVHMDEHQGVARQHDDITMLTLRRLG